GDEGSRGPPASAAFDAGREDDLPRMNAFDPASPTEMGEEKVAGRLDRCCFDLVFDRELENITVPIEIFSPKLRGKGVDSLPGPATESRLVPGTRREARDAEIHARHFLGGPQPRHAGEPPPRPLESAWITIHDPYIGYPLSL